jgi:hypothetical protein
VYRSISAAFCATQLTTDGVSIRTTFFLSASAAYEKAFQPALQAADVRPFSYAVDATDVATI